MMVKEGIEPTIDNQNTYWIPSQTTKGTKYKVVMKENGWCDCSCPDNKNGLCTNNLILHKNS